MPALGPHLSIRRVAKLLDLHPDTVREWVSSGLIPATRFKRALRIAEADLKRFLSQRGTQEPRVDRGRRDAS